MTKKFRKVAALFFLLGTAPFVSNLENVTSENQLRWFILSVATSLVSLMVVASAWWHSLNKRGGRPLPFIGMVTVAIAIGIAFALSVFSFSVVLGLETVQPVANQLVIDSTVVSGGAYLLIAFLRRLEMDRVRRGELLEKAISIFMAQSDGREITARIQQTLNASFEENLGPARANLMDQLERHKSTIETEKWLGVAEDLRKAAEKTVRPYSKELWRKISPETKSIDLRRIVYDVVRSQPFQVSWIVVTYLITALPEVIENLGWKFGSLNLLTGVLLIVFVLGGANRVMRQSRRHHTLIFVTAICLLQSFGLVMFLWRDLWSDNPYRIAEYLASVFFGILIILLSSGISSASQLEKLDESALESRLDEERISAIAANRQLAYLARESARVLHGQVQTRLIASAIAIERAAETQDAQAFHLAMDEALDALSMKDYYQGELAGNLIEEVTQKAFLWSGLCDIELDIPAELGAEMNVEIIRDVGRVVEEGLSNAIRHGEASQILIRVGAMADVLEVEITDNGNGPKNGPTGLGTSLLDTVSREWTLTALEGGARLSVHIPVKLQSSSR